MHFFSEHQPFLSTPSARRATVDEARVVAQHLISIHALREEGDPLDFAVVSWL